MTSRQKWVRRLARLLVACVLVYIVLGWLEHKLVYYPDRQMEGAAAELGRTFEDVRFKASDGVELNGWFFPAGTNSPRSRWVVLHCHGNAGNISHRLGTCKALLQSGVAVFLFDYRGYGRSAGRPTETGTYRDAHAAYDWLRTKGFGADHIIAFGESLGGGIASELAVRQPLGGLVLQSTFTSIPEIGAELYPFLPVRLISKIKYDTASRLPDIHVPVLIMHSRNDELAKFHHAQTNFNRANEPKLFWELTGDHNGALEEPKNFVDGFERFLATIEAQTRAPQPASSR